jgi:hypothetical protein
MKKPVDVVPVSRSALGELLGSLRAGHPDEKIPCHQVADALDALISNAPPVVDKWFYLDPVRGGHVQATYLVLVSEHEDA